MNAFVIIHFGDKIKYFELELYLLFNLKKYTKYDIIYMYSINDTPTTYIKIMKKYCIVIPYNDNNITYNIHNFKSSYTIFNTLRTCNFLFAYELIQYKKICVIESDMIINTNIDNIFDLNTPCILTYYNYNKITENYLIEVDYKKTLNECNKISKVNGGIMLFEPSILVYNLLLKNIEYVIKKNCLYPNETLFLLVYKKIYNLPFEFNSIKYIFNKINKNYNFKNLKIIHFNSKYKHIEIIKDGYLKELKIENKIIYYFLKKYYKLIYKLYYKKINKVLYNLLKV
jgi:hypothetical protein